MKLYKVILVLVIASMFISAVPSIRNTYMLSNNYLVTIHGTSNLHNWDETVGIVSGAGIVDWNTDGSFDLTALSMKLNVQSIKSTEGSIMNNNTYKALKAETNPEISIILNSPIKSIQASVNETAIIASCNLTIAGVTKSVNMHVNVSAHDHAKLEFSGSQIIHMTDYGIDPPTALFGTLKTGNDLTINFKTTFTITNN